MKIVLSIVLAVALISSAAPSSVAEPRQVMQGTQVHLTLLSGINSSIAKDGDPFVAVVAEPVYLGNQLLLPVGTRVNGIIGTVEKARRFSIFRGQAYMNLTFRSIEVDSRLIPVQMSIIAIEQPHGQADGKRRKDVKVEEGQVVQQKHDIKGDIVGGAVGTGHPREQLGPQLRAHRVGSRYVCAPHQLTIAPPHRRSRGRVCGTPPATVGRYGGE